MKTNAIILAAGKGTRMNSEAPKCAHKIIDKPMVEYVYDNLLAAGIQEIITVVGYKREILEEMLKGKCKFALQEKQLGTGHAVLMAKEHLDNQEGLTLITAGDMPFVEEETYVKLINEHIKQKADLTILTTDHPFPQGYGRIIRNKEGEVVEIVEERDCSEKQKEITEVNASIYVVDNQKLFCALKSLKANNTQNEYYLTDIVRLFHKGSYKIIAYKIADYYQINGVNNQLQLIEMEEHLRKRIIKKHLENGVTVHSPNTVVIGKDVIINKETTIYPGTIIIGKTLVHEKVELGPQTYLENAVINSGSKIIMSYIKNATVEKSQKVGPYFRLEKN